MTYPWAITVKYLPATNWKGSRYSVRQQRSYATFRAIFPYESGLSSYAQAENAARKFLAKHPIPETANARLIGASIDSITEAFVIAEWHV
jgi:hypothetical protein